MIQEIADDNEKYDKFYKSFSTSLKLGIINDSQNRARLSKLIRYNTAKNPDKLISLEDYVNNMKKSQKDIYYLGGENKETILQSPLLERLTKRGYDVLVLPDPIDEYTVSTLGKYDSKYNLVDISKDGLKLAEDEEKQKNLKEEYKPLCEYLSGILTEKVSRVEVSTRLTKSPAALVSSTYAHSANMERILKAQALKDNRYMTTMGGKRILEINPRHPLIKKLLQDVVNDEASENTADIANVLYDSAVLNTGYALEKPKTLTDRVLKLVSQNLNIDPDEEVEEEEYVEEEETVEESVGESEGVGEEEGENQHEEL
jgi:HSP90 family molecular chaperone